MKTHVSRCLLPFALWACGAAPVASSAPESTPFATETDMVVPARLLPDIDTSELTPWKRDAARSLFLVGGLRVIVHDDGNVERANERFPSGDVHALAVPQRLGGGFLFFQSDSQGTRLWRARGWKQPLVPLASYAAEAQSVVPGFDRLYLRVAASTQLIAVDNKSGNIVPLGHLPPAGGRGELAFADGWRGVVDTDLRGPMATFDAGESWHPLDISARVVTASVLAGDPVLFVQDGGHYRIDSRGRVHFVAATTDHDDDAQHPARRAQPRPLRLAVERGWPDSDRSAIYAHRGALVRVALPTGDVLSRTQSAYPERNAQCTSARLGPGFGFICGQDGGPTVLYSVTTPLGLSELARFDEPRFVSPSGNGAVVVRGPCSTSAPAKGDARSYCVIWPDGSRRTIGVRGDLGVERVVALSDRRVAVLVPPRVGADGKLTLIANDKLTSVDLRFPDEPARAVKHAKRGLWMEGFENRDGALAGWVEAGGPAIGVRVAFDGEVTLGQLYDKGGQLIASGRFALALNDTEGALESTDGGQSWNALELPGLPAPPGLARTRGCTPVGCVIQGWTRIGWGATAATDDLQLATAPDAVYATNAATRPVRLDCTLQAHEPRAATTSPRPRRTSSHGRNSVHSTWASFRGAPAPDLRPDELGVDKSTASFDRVPAHTYVWGPKGADWSRAGWWQIRFEDRFDPMGGMRASAPTRPTWSDELSAAQGIGAMRRGSYGRWSAELDPGGRAAMLSLCRGTQNCKYFAVSDGRPIVQFSTAGGGPNTKPVPNSVARVGESWFFATELAGTALSLWRADAHGVSHVKRYPLLDRRQRGHFPYPRLVRRALTDGIGWLVTVPRDAGSKDDVARWIVLPINLSDGSLAEPIDLGPADLRGVAPPACDEAQDGWILVTQLSVGTVFELQAVRGYIDNTEYRLRAEPGSMCIDGLSTRASRALTHENERPRSGGNRRVPLDPRSVPMAARGRYSSDLWRFSCLPKSR